MSSSNPNVFLEMGLAMRADKPFVLIKDELTNFQFDTNQFFTFEYNSNLQPRGIKKEIETLSEIIIKTSEAQNHRYSLAKKLSPSITALEATNEGDKTMSLLLDLKEQVSELSSQNKPVPIDSSKSFQWIDEPHNRDLPPNAKKVSETLRMMTDFWKSSSNNLTNKKHNKQDKCN